MFCTFSPQGSAAWRLFVLPVLILCVDRLCFAGRNARCSSKERRRLQGITNNYCTLFTVAYVSPDTQGSADQVNGGVNRRVCLRHRYTTRASDLFHEISTQNFSKLHCHWKTTSWKGKHLALLSSLAQCHLPSAEREQTEDRPVDSCSIKAD